jgi:hypothetical protein
MQMFFLSILELLLSWTGLAIAPLVGRASGWRRVGMIGISILLALIIGTVLIVVCALGAGLIKGLATPAA